jgi:copper chaperone CopZ
LTAADKSKTVSLNISGMTCESCVSTVEKALKKVDGVKDVKVSLKTNSATVVVAGEKTSPAGLIKAVSDAGFTASEGSAPKTDMKKKMKSGSGECEDGCCGEEGAAKSMKSKKTESKKS